MSRHFFYSLDDKPSCTAIANNALVCVMRIAQAVPDSIDRDYFDEIGRLLYPFALASKAEYVAADEGHWPGMLEKAAATSRHEAHVWLGQHLSDTPGDLAGFYGELLWRVEEDTHDMATSAVHEQTHVAALFEMNDSERRILDLAAKLHQWPLGMDWFRSRCSPRKTARAIAAGADVSIEAVTKVLRFNGRLAQSGLLRRVKTSQPGLQDLLALSSFGQHCLCAPHTGVGEVVPSLLAPIGPAQHARDWAAVGSEYRTAQSIVRHAVLQKASGINILLYGEPGSGKTSFARYLAGVTKVASHVIPVASGEGRALSYSERLARLGLAQRYFKGHQACMLVVDDAYASLRFYMDGESFRDGGLPTVKARAQTLLENNPCPVIWICNDIEGLDPQCVSRFTLCINFERPQAMARRRLVEEQLAPIGITEAVMSVVARHQQFSVDLVSASARVAQLAGTDPVVRDEAVLCMMNGQAKALQLPGDAAPVRAATRFDPAYLHVEGRFTAEQVLNAVVQTGHGTLLLNGPPGTGKTQLAAEVAQRLGRELVLLTASDINTKWYGESERNVAKIFSRCHPADQVLFLDEAETVLGARGGDAHRASESVTTEFLRRLEAFPGVFICATNHLNHMDSAMLRRFVFRLEFKPLTMRQRQNLLQELVFQTSGSTLPEPCLQALARMDGLTPGDFANVKKRFALLGHAASLDDWLLELKLEWEAKPDHVRGGAIGFF